MAHGLLANLPILIYQANIILFYSLNLFVHISMNKNMPAENVHQVFYIAIVSNMT